MIKICLGFAGKFISSNSPFVFHFNPKKVTAGWENALTFAPEEGAIFHELHDQPDSDPWFTHEWKLSVEIQPSTAWDQTYDGLHSIVRVGHEGFNTTFGESIPALYMKPASDYTTRETTPEVSYFYMKNGI